MCTCPFVTNGVSPDGFYPYIGIAAILAYIVSHDWTVTR